MAKRWLSCSIAFGLSTLIPTIATAQLREAVLSEMTLQGTVTAVDHTARTVTIRGTQGNIVTLDVPLSVARFDQVKVGDTITAAYYDRVNVRLKDPGEAAVDRTVEPTTTTTAGALPGATIAKQRVATATVTGWDPATRTISFTGPRGASYSRRIAETTDVSVVAGLKPGDRVDVTWTEALRISMAPGVQTAQAAQPPPPAPVTFGDTLRDRLTFSVLWGPDNQFTGKMIDGTDGQTLSGVPINLDEVGFDDVYGRMALFKIGVGYRLSPRNEAVLNFVLSRSSSDVVTIGNAVLPGTTTGATPINVEFDDYNYWGFEGGQRFYFARVRFTPFVGYLVGINRHGDIRGRFVDVTDPSALPGYAAQDGKFFEKSWAFSLGPTGGVLVGLGPIEVMAETQFRFMGGLSDVDWLVEEGLRDINSESSRWSLPFLFGARLRF
jgi:hypothetical protein